MSDGRPPGASVVQCASGSKAAVASGHPLASLEAIRVLQSGGNIVDAAVAGATVLSVVLPYACGIGGDLYLLYHDARTRATHGLNGTGAAPAGAVRERFHEGMPQTGIESATVPGAVRAWEAALQRFGTLGLGEILQTAIRYARYGFPAHRGLHENAIERQRLLGKDAEAARLYLPGGRPHALGQTVMQEDLARSLSLIAVGGSREFYEGRLAKDIVRRIHQLKGLFTLEDLAQHRSAWQAPIGAHFYGHVVLTMPPNSVGIRLLLQLLALQDADIARADPDGERFWQDTIGAWRWAQRNSDEVVGDPAKSAGAAEAVLDRIRADKSAIDLRAQASEGAHESSDTSNLVVIDSEGNAVSLVQSVSGPFASGIVLEGTGILLNNRMRGFSNRAGSVNCVGPGLRPAHTLVPVLVAGDSGVTMAVGTPGAAAQAITLTQVLCRILAHGHSAPEAIAAPRWSVAPSGKIIVERTAAPSVESTLRKLGIDVEAGEVRNVRFGSVKAAWRAGQTICAAADYRRVAAAAAW